MTSNQAVETANHDRAQLRDSPPCPLWKKVLAGLLVVAFVSFLITGTVWVDQMEVSWKEMLTGLALGLGYSIALVLAGILVATSVIWVISRVPEIMSRGSAVIEYLVHCYPEQLKSRILSRG